MTTGSSDSSNVRGSTFATSVIQVTNIAPQATRDQMYTFFSFVGQVDDVRLYPSMRDASISITSRTCFVRFAEPASVTITLHLNNTVFIDRAIIITPVLGNKVPEENEGLVMAMQIQQQQQQGGIGGMASNGMLGGNRGSNNDARILAANPGLVSMHPTGKIATPDAALDEADLPPYPLLTGTTAVSKVEEIRRTITVAGLDSTVSAQQCMEFFAENAGEVKYFRYCTRDHDHVKYALIEFSERASVVSALNLNDRQLGTAIIKVIHSTESINKPQTKSNEAAAKEIEEAMSKVTEASHLVSAAVDPLMGMLTGSVVTAGVGKEDKILRTYHDRDLRERSYDRLTGAGLGSGRNSMARSRSRSRRRSRSRDRDYRSRHRSGSRSRRRSKSRDRGSRRDRHRSRSRSRDRKKSSRHRSRSKESRKERKRSRSKEKKRSRRSRSKEKERTEDKSSENGVDSKGGISDNNGDSNVHKKDVDHETGNNDEIRDESFLPGNNNGETEYEDKGGKRRSRTKSPSRKRSKSKDRGERRKRSRSKDRHSRRRSSRSKSRDRKKRSRSKEKSSSKKSSRHRSKSRDRERNERKRSRSKERNRDSRTNSSKDVRSMKERSPGHASDSRVVRDYDQEEAGFESNGDIKANLKKYSPERSKEKYHMSSKNEHTSKNPYPINGSATLPFSQEFHKTNSPRMHFNESCRSDVKLSQLKRERATVMRGFDTAPQPTPPTNNIEVKHEITNDGSSQFDGFKQQGLLTSSNLIANVGSIGQEGSQVMEIAVTNHQYNNQKYFNGSAKQKAQEAKRQISRDPRLSRSSRDPRIKESKVQDHPYNGKSKDGKLSTLQEDTRGEAMGTEDMEISNSP